MVALESSGMVLQYVCAKFCINRITGLEIVGGPQFYIDTHTHARTHTHTHTRTHTHTHTHTHHTEAHFISLAFLRKGTNKTKEYQC